MCYLSCDRNLNNFQIQSQDYLYVNSQHGLYFDQNGIQIIVNTQTDTDEDVRSMIIKAVRPRGSAAFFYQDSYEEIDWDGYIDLVNSGVEMHAVQADNAPLPSCPLPIDDVAWNLVYAGEKPATEQFIVVCTGLAEMQSTYGDSRIMDYEDDAEGHTVYGGVVYTYNFTARAGDVIQQVWHISQRRLWL